MAILEGRVGGERADRSLQPHHAVRIRLRRAAVRDDRGDEVRMRDRPLKRLLRAHRKTHDRTQMGDAKL